MRLWLTMDVTALGQRRAAAFATLPARRIQRWGAMDLCGTKPARGGAEVDLDDRLLTRATEDPDAFGDFYHRHRHAVVAYFARRTGCPETAADLTADTFTEALRTVHRFHPERGEARAWLFGIASNQLKRFHRSTATADRALRHLRAEDREPDHSAAVAAEADVELARPAIEAGLASLSGSVRTALLLRIVHGLGYAEIASRVACTNGAARVRVSRGLSALALDQALAATWFRLRA